LSRVVLGQYRVTTVRMLLDGQANVTMAPKSRSCRPGLCSPWTDATDVSLLRPTRRPRRKCKRDRELRNRWGSS